MSDQQRTTSLRYAAKVARITARDLRWGAKSVLLNTVGGSPLMPRAGRIALLRAFGAEVGSTGLFPGWTLEGDTHNLHIGTGCFFNTRTFIESVAEVRIGNDVAFGMEVMILTSHHDIGADGRWAAETSPRPVVIGDNVWVGARATILPGVTIGEGTIIAAGAVVAKDCEPWSVYGGVPAKRIKGLRDGDSPTPRSDAPAAGGDGRS